MLKRELKVNFKSFIIWTIIICVIYFLILMVYPFLVEENNLAQLDQMMAMFPDALLKAFNMDISSMSSTFGWLKSEGYTLIVLICCIYSGIMGSNILLKEENDKTIEYLNSLPISRNYILNSKVICGLIYIIFFISLTNYLGLIINEEINFKTYFYLSLTPIFSSIVVYFLSLYISSFRHKEKNMISISFGIVFISYFLQIISLFSKKTEFFKYLSIFSLSFLRYVIENNGLNYVCILISMVLCIILYFLTKYQYNKKELI